MLMYLMDDGISLNLLLSTLLFRGFLGFLFLFTFFYTVRVKKNRLFNKFLSQNRQPIWQEKRDGDYEGRKGIIFCILHCILYVLFIE